MVSIELRAIRKRFGDATAVADLDLRVEPGRRMVLLGRSGAGKTTLLRLIAGLVQPDAGKVLLDSQDVTHAAPASRNVSLVTQDYALYPQLSVQQNLQAALVRRHLKPHDQMARIDEVLRWFQIEALRSRLPAQLSGGQAQRVAFAKAVVRRPNVLLLDEPLSQLDPLLRRELHELILSINEQFPMTLVMVTHEPLDAILLGTDIAVMEHGRILQCGEPQAVYQSPQSKLVAELMSPFGMNWLTLAALSDSGDFEFQGTPPAGSQTLGIRPEHVRAVSPQSDRRSEMALDISVQSIKHVGFGNLVVGQVAGMPLRILDYRQQIKLGRATVAVSLDDCVWLESNGSDSEGCDSGTTSPSCVGKARPSKAGDTASPD